MLHPPLAVGDDFATVILARLASRFDVTTQWPHIVVGAIRQAPGLVDRSDLLLLQLGPFFAAGPDNGPLLVMGFKHQEVGFLFVVAEHLLHNGHDELHAVDIIVKEDDVVRGKRLVFRILGDFGKH